MNEITLLDPQLFTTLANDKRDHVHMVMIATKPDIIKQIPIYKELERRGHLVILCHTGQHYDENLSGGMLKEFGVEPHINLNVRGAMHEVVSQIIGRLGYVIDVVKQANKIVVPYVHGDTTTAMAASNAAYCHGFTSVHIEAGIRTLTPKRELLLQLKNAPRITQETIARFAEQLRMRHNWELGSREPIPEQFNTRCSEAASGLHLAPVELDKEFMLSEGFTKDRIITVGNSVADATLEALDNSINSTIFERYPLLQNGDFARFCIHRRENCFSKERFTMIFSAMKELAQMGKNILLISLFQTEAAIDRFGLRSDMDALAKLPNVIYSPVWPLYTDVIAAMSKAAVCVTDSGSMQEEMNILGVPCVTLRFGSDRSESIMNGGNVLAPLINADIIKESVLYAWDRKAMRIAPKLYGSNVSAKCIDEVEAMLRLAPMNRTEEQRLGL
jgi:UDP-N-acetylglucosamine 2-epimerase (non-hydrolysing)